MAYRGGMVFQMCLVIVYCILQVGDGLRDDKGNDVDEGKIGTAYDEMCGSALVDKGLGEERLAVKGFATALVLLPNVTVAW